MFIPFRLFLRLTILMAATQGGFSSAIAQDTTPSSDFKTLASAANAARDGNNSEQAIRNYREALKLQPDWQEGLWNLGSLEYERDHYADAIAPLRRLTELAPRAAPAWTFLGLCEFETKDYASARQHLDRGQQLGGGGDEEILRVAKYHLALLMIRDGDFDDATTMLQGLATSNQPNAQIKTALGLAALRVPLLPQEIDSSRDALLEESGDAAAQLARGETATAVNTYAALTRKYPGVPYLHRAYGQALLVAGSYKDAAAQSREEIALSPEAAAAHGLLARSLEAAGEPEQAREEFAASTKLLPKEISERQRVARFYANGEVASGGGASGGTENAELWNAAMSAYSTQRYAEAIAALKRWVERTPNRGTAWAVMGLAEFELKDYDNALIHLQRGQQLGLNGNFESVQLARYKLATLMLQKRQFEHAQDLLMSVAGHGPLAGEVRFALGMSLLRIGAWPGQVEISKKPLVAGAGEIGELLKDSKYDQVFTKCEALIRQHPETPFVHYIYGTGLANFSRYEQAAEQFREEIKINPETELPLLQLASIALKEHRVQEALLFAQRAVKVAPASAESHYLLGRASLEMGNDQQAIAELESAKTLAPDSAQIHYNLAKAYGRANLPEKAENERLIFSSLNAKVENQRSTQGSQSYGAHNTNDSGFSPVDTGRPAPQ